MARVKVRNPLRLLSKLRRFDKDLDVKEFLNTEFRQSLKAVEDAFNNIYVDESDLTVSSGTLSATSGLVSSTTNSPSYVASAMSIDLESDGSPILLVTTVGFETLTNTSEFKLVRNAADDLYYMMLDSFGISGPPNYKYPIVYLDLNPPVGTVNYKWYYRNNTSNTAIITNSTLKGLRWTGF